MLRFSDPPCQEVHNFEMYIESKRIKFTCESLEFQLSALVVEIREDKQYSFFLICLNLFDQTLNLKNRFLRVQNNL